MIFGLIIIISLIVSCILYNNLRNEVSEQINFIDKLTSGNEVRNRLREAYTGYIMCLDVTHQPKTRKEVKDIISFMSSIEQNFLVFDGSSAFLDDPQLVVDLKTQTLPSIIALKNGVIIQQPITLSYHSLSNSQIVDKVKNFVGSTIREVSI
ncbi:hypothetical protein [Paenibacillus sp. MBLB4367]|uniref:hypothetical protein n=1 Tax=Paenibacillus sp. MBLB4367 TaxID=3384767 RepID=UPI003908439F